MLAGGPGQTAFKPDIFLLFQLELLGGVLESRDIIIMDQRGTEHTGAFFDCPEIYSFLWAANEQKLNTQDATALYVEIVQSCIGDYRVQGINFDAYKSVETAPAVSNIANNIVKNT